MLIAELIKNYVLLMKTRTLDKKMNLKSCFIYIYIYRMFSAQAVWTLTHMSHKDTEQSAIEASVMLDDVTLTDPLIR
jgi:hypothetical protein